MTRHALLELRDVGFTYPAAASRRARPFALADLSFSVEQGEIVGVIGPNSAGKTTLIRLVTRVLEPAAGEIALDGRPLRRWDSAGLARRIAVVPQGVPPQFPFTVEELVLMGRYPHGPGRYFESAADLAAGRAAMAATGVLELAALQLESLSGGERQRVAIARALAQEPGLLILDEPTAHLDLRHQAESAALLKRLNREQGMTCLLVSHDLNLASEVCDRLLLIAGGQLVAAGAPEAVLEESVLAAVFGCEVTVEKSPTTRRPVVQLTWRVDSPNAGAAASATANQRR
ncbi:MAG: ABC transporter ATP-binding protein [candidate division NC10 bacterium]